MLPGMQADVEIFELDGHACSAKQARLIKRELTA
jgi:hypothetical protein